MLTKMRGQNHIKPERNIISGSTFVAEQRNIDSWHLKCKFWWVRLVTISTLVRYTPSPDVTSLQLPQDRGITNWAKQNNAISNNQQQYYNTATCLLRLVGRIVVIKFGVLLDAFIIVHPPIIRRRDVAVPAVRCSPVEHVFRFNGR
jgi:hypothetical protein